MYTVVYIQGLSSQQRLELGLDWLPANPFDT